MQKGSQQERGQAMDTKNIDSRTADPNVSAPRVEPGAANMTIPRRDLLTGTALVLLGSASGCGPGQPASSGGASWQLRTQFMEDFTKKFIGPPAKIKPPGTPDLWPDPPNSTDPPTRIWPKSGQLRPDIVADYATFANVLMTVGYVKASLPTFPSGSLGDDIVQFLTLQNWPNAKPCIPPDCRLDEMRHDSPSTLRPRPPPRPSGHTRANCPPCTCWRSL